MNKKLILISIVILVLFIFLLIQFSSCSVNFIKNASDGMEFQLNPNDVLLIGKGVYSKTLNNDTIKIAICEECGTDNDCLGNNLNMLNLINTVNDNDVIKRYGSIEGAQIIENNKLIRKYNLSSSDLKEFYVYPLTYNELESFKMPNETIYQAYYRYKGACGV